ncbi:MAG: sulfite oxidase heme-binding subunit YedZ, partial [Woeseiaceae bacterium]
LRREPEPQAVVIRILQSRYFIWCLLALPIPVWLTGYARGVLFYGEVLHASGVWSVRLLLLALAITPLKLLLPDAVWTQWLARRRRYLGVAACAYAFVHAAIYLEKKAAWSVIASESLEAGMWTGWLALCVFALLAATSNDASVRRLKRRWKQLHRFVHAAAVLTFLHWFITAFDPLPAMLHASVLLLLELARLMRWRSNARDRSPNRRTNNTRQRP